MVATGGMSCCGAEVNSTSNGGPGIIATGGAGLNLSGAGIVATGGTNIQLGNGGDGGDFLGGGLGGNGISAEGGGSGMGNGGCGGIFVGGDFGGTACVGGANDEYSDGADGMYAAVSTDQISSNHYYAGYFTGDLNFTGTIYAGTKDFKIDHPLDPAKKYLVHASVESSEMMNIYTGNITTDAKGEAIVRLPGWFEALNTDFRYQLTVIGQFAQAIVASEIQDHRFLIRTNVPNVKVSWQVTGVRQDAFAKSHPLVLEEEKETRLRGFYIHPELYGAPAQKQIEWARHPQMMKRMQKMRAQQLAASPKQAAPRN
jgi:hypothetical protein